SWVPGLDAADGPAAGAAGVDVAYERVDAHTVRLRASTPPGFIVVRDRFDPGRHARDEGGMVPLVPVGAEAWAVRTPGGSRPMGARSGRAWRAPAAARAGLGLVVAIAMATRGRREEAQRPAAAARSA